jgi:glyoxylase I family protein
MVCLSRRRHRREHRSRWKSDWDEVLLKQVSGLVYWSGSCNTRQPRRAVQRVPDRLDHLEFEVAGRNGLERWRERLTRLGIAHSGIKDHLITFRDPDNIQLEFFWPKPTS